MLMTTDPGDLVFDPTCGSGTTAFVAEKRGRRWITCDTSRVALALARQRLMTATFDYYRLADPLNGVGGGFIYKTVPKVSAAILAYDLPPEVTTLYDRPNRDSSKHRVTGPFTVEAVPAPTVLPLSEAIEAKHTNAYPVPSTQYPVPSTQYPVPSTQYPVPSTQYPVPSTQYPVPSTQYPVPSTQYPVPSTQRDRPDNSIARQGETVRQAEWRDEFLQTGILGVGGRRITLARLEPLPSAWLHAEGETVPDAAGGVSRRVAVSFGPQHAPLEQIQVERALEAARELIPRPKLLVFAAFQFDPEAAKDIAETRWPGVTLLRAQMNADLLTGDLKKKRSSNESFFLVGQPELDVEQVSGGRFRVKVLGDYFDTVQGKVTSGGPEKIAVWLLDPDYDGRSSSLARSSSRWTGKREAGPSWPRAYEPRSTSPTSRPIAVRSRFLSKPGTTGGPQSRLWTIEGWRAFASFLWTPQSEPHKTHRQRHSAGPLPLGRYRTPDSQLPL